MGKTSWKTPEKHKPPVCDGALALEGLKVKCATCGLALYETTEHYNPDAPLRGHMLRLTAPYKTHSWPVYDGALAVASTSRFMMFCAQCSGYISTTGKLSFAGDSEPVPVPEKHVPMTPEPEKHVPMTPEPEKLVLTPDPMTPEEVIMKVSQKR